MKQRLWVLVGVGAVAAIAVYFAVDPAGSVWFPKCPLLLATGLECPGCGSQRAVHALLHGDLRGAIESNVLFVVAIPYLLGTLWRPKSDRGKRVRQFFYGAPALWTVLGLVLFFFVVRNV